MLQALIDSVSDVATLVAQGAVGFIADHSSIRKDGILLFLIKILVSTLVYIILVIGIPLAVLYGVVAVVLPHLFT